MHLLPACKQGIHVYCFHAAEVKTETRVLSKIRDSSNARIPVSTSWGRHALSSGANSICEVGATPMGKVKQHAHELAKSGGLGCVKKVCSSGVRWFRRSGTRRDAAGALSALCASLNGPCWLAELARQGGFTPGAKTENLCARPRALQTPLRSFREFLIK